MNGARLSRSSRRLGVRLGITFAVLLATGWALFASPASAGTISRSGATLSFAAAGGEANTVALNGSGTLTFTDSTAPVTAGSGCTQINSSSASCSGAGVNLLALDLGDGIDMATLLSSTVAASVQGGSGADFLLGTSDADYIDGGPGSDTIHGLGGVDTVSYLSRSVAVDVTLCGCGGNGPAGESDFISSDLENIWGGSGNDHLVGDGNVNTINGGIGNDTLEGLGGADVLSEAAFASGNDRLLGGDGGDVLEGGNDDDTFVGGIGVDTMVGGAGIDSADYSASTKKIAINLSVAGGDGEVQSNGFTEGDAIDGTTVEGVIGSPLDDFALGASGQNVFDGRGGDDTLDGAGGADQLTGGAGADVLQGSAGVDTVSYADHSESVTADIGGSHDGVQDEGDSIMEGVEGITGGSGNDFLSGDGNANPLTGGPGDDTLIGRGGADLIHGNGGVDDLMGGVGEDTIYGDAQNDAISGGEDQDGLQGGDGDDRIGGGAAGDTIAGGSGSDVADYSGRSDGIGFRTDGLANDGAPGEGDAIADDVEGAAGGLGADTLIGGDGAGRFNGGPGDDTIDAGTGADSVAGGDGTDRLSYATRSAGVSVTLDGVANDGNGDDGNGDDVGADIEQLTGGAAGDHVVAGAGPIEVNGGAGADELTGGSSNDNLSGGDGNDNLSGGDGSDRVDGNGDGDSLSGGGGGDSLEGGPGSDTLDGGTGPDTFSGGDGADTASYAWRNAGVSVTIDGTADDGEPGEADDVRANVEAVVGGFAADSLTGSPEGDTLVGGSGPDVLRGGAGADQIFSRDAFADDVACGPDIDSVDADQLDKLFSDCERASVKGASISVLTRSARLSRSGALKLRVRCGGIGDCAGTMALNRTGGKRAKLAAKKFSIGAGKTAVLKLKLKKPVAKSVSRHGLKVRATVTFGGSTKASPDTTVFKLMPHKSKGRSR